MVYLKLFFFEKMIFIWSFIFLGYLFFLDIMGTLNQEFKENYFVVLGGAMYIVVILV